VAHRRRLVNLILQELTIEITARPPLEITTKSLPAGALSTAYSAKLEAKGGLIPYSWRIARDKLPDGLHLNSESGKISGTPTIGGVFQFTVEATDNAVPADTTTKVLSITISNIVTYLEEDFEDGDFAGWIIVDEGTSRAPSDWLIYWNALEQNSDIYDGDRDARQPDLLGTYAYWNDLSWTDYEATLELRSDDDDAIGVMFRYQDADNYYRFSMDNERQYRRLIRKYQGTVTVLAEANFGFKMNFWNLVKIKAIGESISIYLNEELIFNVNDAAIASGGIALYSWYNSAAKFDNIVVKSPALAKRLPSGEERIDATIPKHFAVLQNYPNPFNSTTWIPFDIPEPSNLQIKIYNALGEEVRTLRHGPIEPGCYQICWNGRNNQSQVVGSGVFVIRIHYQPKNDQQNSISKTRKIVFVK